MHQLKIDRSPELVYKGGYKYQLLQPYFIQTPLRPEKYISNGWVSLDTNGVMMFMPGYAYDGPTWAPDTKATMVGSLAHDGGCQLMRAGLLPLRFKPILDKFMADTMRRDGLWTVIAKIFYLAVHKLGKKYAVKPTKTIRILTP
jgi:hypothetical protein